MLAEFFIRIVIFHTYFYTIISHQIVSNFHVFPITTISTRRTWSVSRGCLLLHPTCNFVEVVFALLLFFFSLDVWTSFGIITLHFLLDNVQSKHRIFWTRLMNMYMAVLWYIFLWYPILMQVIYLWGNVQNIIIGYGVYLSSLVMLS